MKKGERDKSYKDFGFKSNEEAKQLLEYCRSEEFRYHDILRICAESVNTDIATELCITIYKKLSYDRLLNVQNIPVCKKDFYACRRMTLGKLKKCLADAGIRY